MLCCASGGCSASASRGERVLPQQENQAAAGLDGRERHSCWRNQGHEGHVGGQRKKDQRPTEKGDPLKGCINDSQHVLGHTGDTQSLLLYDIIYC